MSSKDSPRKVLGSIVNVGAGPVALVPLVKPKVAPKKLRTAMAEQQRKTKGLTSFPLDILFGICHQLDLESLFTLSLTSKACRATLVAPSAKPIWARARVLAGLPAEIVSDMTDVQHANLAVGTGCQVCFRKVVTRTDHYLRVRMCGPCSKANLVDASPAHRDFQGGPAALWSLKCSKNTVLSCISVSVVSSAKAPGGVMHQYYVPHVFAMDALMLRMDLHGEEWRSFHKKRRAVVQKREDDAGMLVAWDRLQEEAREDARQEIRNTRRNDIEARLIEAGWNPCVFDSTWRLQKVLSDPKPVTDRTWPAIREKVEPFLKLHLALVLERQLKQRQIIRRGLLVPFYLKYRSTLGSWGRALLPPLYVVLAMDAFRVLWQPDNATAEQSTWDAAIESDLLPFEKALKRNFYDAIAQSHTNALRSEPLLPIEALSTDPTDAEMNRVFQLPTSTFLCRHSDPVGQNGTCSSVERYPEILHHAIARHSVARRDDRDSFAGVHLLDFDAKSWIDLSLYNPKISHEKWALELGGFLLNKVHGVTDKNKATKKCGTTDVNTIGPRLECMVSVGGPYGRDRCHRSELDFRGMVEHLRCSHPNKTGAAGCFLISSVRVQ